MPSLTSYTPFETLKFCQSIVQYGADATAFQDIATALNASELIRESGTYDAKRFTVEALHNLYEELLRQESDDLPKINGDATTANARKRKLSASPQPPGGSQEDLVLSLVEKLYARFREEAIKDIKREEDEYIRLQDQIKELETQPVSGDAAPEAAQTSEQARQEAPSQGGLPVVQDGPHSSATLVSTRPLPGHQTPAPPEVQPTGQVASSQQQHMSPAPYNRAVPTPPPRPQTFQPQGVPPPHGYAHPPQGHPQAMPYGPGPHPMAPPIEYGSRKGSS